MGRATRKQAPKGSAGGGGGRKKGNGRSRKTVESVSKQIVTELLEAVRESGELPWHRPWNVGARPRNAISGRPYRGLNPFYLSLVAQRNGYQSSRWLTYKQAEEESFQQWRREKNLPDDDSSRKQYGEDPDAYRGVRKGEKAVQVVGYFPVEERDKNNQPILDANGQPKTRKVARYYNVWNADQTGLEFPAEDVGERSDLERIEAAEDIVKGFAGRPRIEHGGDMACYVPSEDVIRMPLRERFHSDAQYYHVLFHEMVHSTGHQSRTNRTKGQWGGMRSDSYAEEELVAEIGAAILSAQAGTQSPEDMRRDSAPYLAGWLKRLAEDPEMFMRAGTRAQTAVDHILGTEFD